MHTHTYTHTCKYIFIFLAVNVKVTHVETPEEFFIQYVKELPKLNNINKQIARHCKKVKQEAILQPGEVIENPYYVHVHAYVYHWLFVLFLGIICTVFSEDEEWKRAKIEKVNWGNPPYATIFFIDFGNTTIVSMGR